MTNTIGSLEDVQSQLPTLRVSLSRVGVTNVEKVIRLRAGDAEHKPAPVSGIQTQEIYSLLGSAVASEAGTRRLIGVRAQGMTACPCAQTLVQARSRERLLEDGFSDEEIARIFAAVPVATHNQRGLGTLYIGCPETCLTDIDAEWLVKIVEDSMSS